MGFQERKTSSVLYLNLEHVPRSLTWEVYSDQLWFIMAYMEGAKYTRRNKTTRQCTTFLLSHHWTWPCSVSNHIFNSFSLWAALLLLYSVLPLFKDINKKELSLKLRPWESSSLGERRERKTLLILSTDQYMSSGISVFCFEVFFSEKVIFYFTSIIIIIRMFFLWLRVVVTRA